MMSFSDVMESHPFAVCNRVAERLGPESRLGIHMKESHAITPWTVDHAVDSLSKLTPYERREGKKLTQETVKIVETLHKKLSLRGAS